MNLFNSRWSPEGRNLLNSSGWEDYNGELDYRPERDGPAIPVPLPFYRNDPQREESLYHASGGNDPMPVFKPGEVSSEPEEYPRGQGAGPLPPPQADGWFGRAVNALRNEVTGEGRREAGVEELPPWVKISGQDASGYSKIGLARDNMAAAKEIALKQFPGSSIREDRWGNAVIKLPDGATRTDWRVTGSDMDGNPTFEARDVPLSGEYYLNKPGLSVRDAANAAIKGVFTGAGSGVGSFAGGAAGMPIAGAGMGGAIGLEAMEAAAQLVGSNQDIDWRDVIRAGFTSAGMKAGKRFLGG